MLERLNIRSFRGFADLEIAKLSRINVVAGKNNAGKTSLLEAIYLLGGAGNAGRMAINRHLIRMPLDDITVRSISETAWKPLFFGLDTDSVVTISGHHSSLGDLALKMSLARPTVTEVQRGGDDGGVQMKEHFAGLSLRFTYRDAKRGALDSEARETTEKVVFIGDDTYSPFALAIVQPGRTDSKLDATHLGELRKRKRGDWLLNALRFIEPRLQGVEDNSSSGEPMIWVDIGLPELLPLSAMGAGMTYFARIATAAALIPGGVLLVDEVENGLHHSILPAVWQVIGKAAEQLNVQVFATTHSLECVEAAHEALGPDGFGLHRLEVIDGATGCVTYEPDAIDGAIRHNMEVR